MTAPLGPLRNDRATATRTPIASRGGATSNSASDVAPADQARLTAQHQAFDFEAAEQAEILREHEALEALLMTHLKNEDEIMKKWIALI